MRLSRLWSLVWSTGILVPIAYLLLLFWRAPHLDPRDWDYDEGINLMKALLVGRGYELFSEIWSDQPPLLTVALAAVFQATGPSVAAARVLVMLLSALLLWAFYLCVRSSLLDARGLPPATRPGAAGGATIVALLASGMLVVSEFFLRLSGAVMVGLPSTALGLLALMLLMVGRRTWPWLLAAAVLMALGLQTKLLAAILLPAAAVAIYVNKHDDAEVRLLASWRQRLGAVVAWSSMLLVVYLLVGLALGALRFDLLFGTHLGAMTANVQNFTAEASGFFPHFLEQHLASLLLAGGGLAYAAVRRMPGVLVPFTWLMTAALVFSVQRPLWYHHTLLLGIPLTWLAAFGMAGLAALVQHAWRRRTDAQSVAGGLAGLVAAAGVLALFWYYPTPLPDRLAAQMTIYRPNYIQSVADRLLADAAAGDRDDWIFTDHPFYAFQAGLAVPPEIAVLSRKTLEANIIRQEHLAQVMRDYKPRFVLFERFTDSYSPEVMDEIHAHYTKEIEEGPARYYIRHE
jgi:4-amino-4-deoxy-L-arabinose transferase-like glycosyltransferase